MKKCDICQKEIPDDFQNLLCLDCYKKVEDKRLKEEEIKKTSGIESPDYIENPEMEVMEQWKTNIRMFERMGILLYPPTKYMYSFVKDYCLKKVLAHPQYPKFIWKPKIVDVGCGCGAGSNILSQEADFVWGIDKDQKSIKFAKEAFTRIKNGIYYSSQISFDLFDIIKETRETMKFDLIVAIEVIEHIFDTVLFLTNLIKRFDKRNTDEPTEYFFSTPNRNHRSIAKNQPKNKFHIREWTSQEFHKLLSQFFGKVELFNAKGIPVEIETNHTPILSKCSLPKI